MPVSADWIRRGEQALLDLLDQEHAVVWNEAQAKISDIGRKGNSTPNPHVLTIARSKLIERGLLLPSTQRTRGGRVVEILTPTNTQGRKRAIETAAARKRLLEARYLGWASGSSHSGPSLIGPAGEAVVHASLTAAAPNGYRLVRPQGGDVQFLLGSKVPGGPLDNAAFLTTLDPRTISPSGTYLVAIEVKNIRSWVYPSKSELYQLLHKAGELQAANPEVKIVPVFVCRRAHHLTFTMADQLGFYVIQTRRQYIRPHIAHPDPTPLDEVRQELGYDLEPHDDKVDAMVEHFTTRIPSTAPKTAERWSITGPQLKDLFKELRNDSLTPTSRWKLTSELAETAVLALDEDQRWHNTDDEPP